MASLAEMVAALFGGGKEPKAPAVTHAASQPQGYPSSEDVAFARKQDYSYGQPWAREFSGDTFRRFNSDWNKPPYESERMPDNEYKARPELRDYHAKAALASQNSALATLGYDPNRLATDVDTPLSKYRVSVTGLYHPKSDTMYANVDKPSTAVHESIHRGVKKLRDTPHWDRRFSDLGEENVVRWLMHQRVGDAEQQEGIGSLGQQDIDQAKRSFTNEHWGESRRKTLADMEAAAAKYLAEKRPMGPR